MLNWENFIESTPSKLFGKPVFAGTRIPVDLILEKLASNDTMEDIIAAYPVLTPEHLSACFIFASESIKNEVVYAKAS